MPCHRADFAFFHASCRRESPFERVNFRRAARHSRRRTDSWSFHQYTESPVRPCPWRSMEWSHAATAFRLATRTVSSNDPADLAQPSSFMSQVSSRCLCSLSLLSRLASGEAPKSLLAAVVSDVDAKTAACVGVFSASSFSLPFSLFFAFMLNVVFLRRFAHHWSPAAVGLLSPPV